jgi:hypothetical protein
MFYWLRWIIAAFFIATILNHGGEGDFAKFYLSIILSLILLLLAIGLPSRTREIDIAWIISLFLPPILLCLVQVLPISAWNHPWLIDDLSLLDKSELGYGISIIHGKTYSCLYWFLTLAGSALTLSALFRGERVRALSDGTIIFSGLHSLLGLILLLGNFDWPSLAVNHARGSFVYTNHAAAFWSACLPLSILSAHSLGHWWRWSSVFLLSLAILLSGSRGGILISAIVCLPLIPSLLPHRRRWLWAVGIASVTAIWLLIIGLQDLGQRFSALNGKEGLTLNGRIIIWETALPVIFDAGPLGSGAGTTLEAYRRSGDSTFSPFIVDHLHSDPLEWWMEFGWCGILLGLLSGILTIWLLWPMRNDKSELRNNFHILRKGSILGLLILLLHSCGDFIFHSPGIDLLSIVLITIISQCRRNPDELRITNPFSMRMAMAIVAFSIFSICLPIYRYERDNILARDIGNFTYQRLSKNLPIDNSALISSALSISPSSVSLATMQSWLWRNLPATPADRKIHLVNASDSLEKSSSLSPGDARAWTERAALDIELGLPNKSAAAAHRALIWAPAWPDIQLAILNLARVGKNFPDKDIREIIQRLLVLNIDQPNWFFPLASKYIGDQSLSTQIASGQQRLQRSGWTWLSEHGQLVDWLQVCRQLLDPPAILPIECQIMANKLYHNLPTRLVIPSSNEERRRIADILHLCGIALPDGLATKLASDGEPWSHWEKPIDLLDAAERTSLNNILRGELHRDWARNWSERIATINRILDGDWSSLNRESDPSLLYSLASSKLPRPIPNSIKELCQLILERYHAIEWQRLTDHICFSWLFVNHSGSNAFVSTTSWTGLINDGHWAGWIRGPVDLVPIVGAGLHRLVIINP